MATPQQEEALRILNDPEAFMAFDPTTLQAQGVGGGPVPPQPGPPGGVVAPVQPTGPTLPEPLPPRLPATAGAPAFAAPATGSPFAAPAAGVGADPFAAPSGPVGKGEEIARVLGRTLIGILGPEARDLIDSPFRGSDPTQTFQGQRGGLTTQNQRTGAIAQARASNALPPEKPQIVSKSSRLVNPDGTVLLAAEEEPSKLLGKTLLDTRDGTQRIISRANLRDTLGKVENDPNAFIIAPTKTDVTTREGAEELVKTRGNAIQMFSIVNQLREPGRTVGFLGKAADRIGGLAESVISEEAGRAVASFLAGGETNPAKLRVARTAISAIALQSKEYLTGEGTSRISDSERDLVLNIVAGLDNTSSDQQVAEVFLQLAGLSIINDEILLRELGKPPVWDVSTDAALEDTLERMERVLNDPADALGVVMRLVQEHEKVTAFGG